MIERVRSSGWKLEDGQPVMGWGGAVGAGEAVSFDLGAM